MHLTSYYACWYCPSQTFNMVLIFNQFALLSKATSWHSRVCSLQTKSSTFSCIRLGCGMKLCILHNLPWPLRKPMPARVSIATDSGFLFLTGGWLLTAWRSVDSSDLLLNNGSFLLKRLASSCQKLVSGCNCLVGFVLVLQDREGPPRLPPCPEFGIVCTAWTLDPHLAHELALTSCRWGRRTGEWYA